MKKLFYYFLFIIFCSCSQKKQESHLNGFDVSPDVKNIVFSYKKDSLYNIYTQSIGSNEKPHIIFKGLGNYVNPKYFNNGKTIISLFYPNHELAPEFHFYDLISNKMIKKIKVDLGFISDYVFTPDNKLLYLQAKAFKSYSPIATKSYHDYDIYELDLITLESRKISNFNSYYMGEILIFGKDVLVSIQGEPSESGLFLFNIFNTDHKISLDKIIINNDTFRNSTMYANPVILSDNSILCSSSYQMVKLDLRTKLEHPILPSTGYHYSQIKNINNIIFFKQNDDTDDIYYFRMNDKKIKSLHINIDSTY